jgi:hypothetical protein
MIPKAFGLLRSARDGSFMLVTPRNGFEFYTATKYMCQGMIALNEKHLGDPGYYGTKSRSGYPFDISTNPVVQFLVDILPELQIHGQMLIITPRPMRMIEMLLTEEPERQMIRRV